MFSYIWHTKHVSKRKELINWTLSKWKTSVLLKTVFKMERKAWDCEKVFAKHISHKGLVIRKMHMLHTCGCISTYPYVSDISNPS